jgi:iron-sulfur cluster repair protein YtfE (RIC family)
MAAAHHVFCRRDSTGASEDWFGEVFRARNEAGRPADRYTKFAPKNFHDECKANVERLIDQKQKGERLTVAKSEKPAPVVNILEALRKSLSENKQTSKPKRKGRAA